MTVNEGTVNKPASSPWLAMARVALRAALADAHSKNPPEASND